MRSGIEQKSPFSRRLDLVRRSTLKVVHVVPHNRETASGGCSLDLVSGDLRGTVSEGEGGHAVL